MERRRGRDAAGIRQRRADSRPVGLVAWSAGLLLIAFFNLPPFPGYAFTS